jgi:hypothetical protein
MFISLWPFCSSERTSLNSGGAKVELLPKEFDMLSFFFFSFFFSFLARIQTPSNRLQKNTKI